MTPQERRGKARQLPGDLESVNLQPYRLTMNKLQTWNTLPYTLKLSGLFLQYQKFCMAVDALDLEVSQFSGCLGFSLLLMKILGAILE